MSLVRVGCVVYCLLLTFFLLVPDPLALLGIESLPGPPGGRGVHLLLFFLLAVLVCASRLPIRPRVLAGLLVAYALTTETLQLAVPTRTVELLDYAENLAGLAAGAAAWGWFERRRERRSPPREG
jgi:hypothetical protein